MLIATTTVATPEEAESLAEETVRRGLAACVQICGIVSHYRWEGKWERAPELRLTFKLLDPQLPALEAFVLDHHPYDTPEWIVLRAEKVSEKYLSWAEANLTSPTPLTIASATTSAMSQHKSLQGASGIVRKRNVLKRFERIEILRKRGQWKAGDRVQGLRKTRPDV